MAAELTYRVHDLLGALLDLDDHRAGFAGQLQSLLGLLAAAGHALHRGLRQVLILLHHVDDFLGGLAGTPGQLAYLVGDHREAATLITGAGRLDGGVEGQQIGLVGDAANGLHDGC